ncbi:MAG: hypothetical protein RL077_4743 [Verrucomicrobiota bacterium]
MFVEILQDSVNDVAATFLQDAARFNRDDRPLDLLDFTSGAKNLRLKTLRIDCLGSICLLGVETQLLDLLFVMMRLLEYFDDRFPDEVVGFLDSEIRSAITLCEVLSVRIISEAFSPRAVIDRTSLRRIDSAAQHALAVTAEKQSA